MKRRNFLKSAVVTSTIAISGCQSLNSDSTVEQQVECTGSEYMWPTYRGTGSRTNVTNQLFPDAGGDVEQFSSANSRDVLGVTGPPVVGVDTAYIPRLSHLEARNIETGELRWRKAIEGNLRTTPALGCGFAFVATKEQLYAIQLSDGTVQWQRDVRGDMQPDQSPVFADGTVYTVGYDNVVSAFDAAGEELWQANVDADVTGLAVDEHVYLSYDRHTDGEGGIISIDRNGDERWRLELEKLGMAAAIQNETFYFVSAYGRLYAVSVDGNVLWKTQIDFTPARTPTVAHGNVYVDAGGRTKCMAFDTESGDQQWTYETGMTDCGILATSDYVYAPGNNSGVHKLKSGTGDRVEQYPDIVSADIDLVVQGDSVFYLPDPATELYQYRV